jgi:hypothetical protein
MPGCGWLLPLLLAFQTSQIHAQPNGMVGEIVGFAIALAANVSD